MKVWHQTSGGFSVRKRLPIGWLAAVVLLASATLGASAGGEIQRGVTAFYDLYVKLHPQGIPQEKELAQFRPYLSQALMRDLQRGRQAEQRYQKVQGGAVPPLIEGDLFTSLFEGASGFSIISCAPRGETASCEVEFRALDPKDRSLFKWKDKIYLVRELRRWVVDDIEYLGSWPFMHKGRLKTVLAEAIKDSR